VVDQASEALARVIETNAWLAPLAAFAGGTLTAANPCVIAAVPLMMAYLAGQEAERGVLRSFLLSLTFAIGLTTMFAILFLATWAASSFLRADWWIYVAAGVCLLMGLHLLGVLDFTIPAPAGVKPSQQGFIGALLLGLLFGLVSLPCAGPILLVLLSLVPVKGAAFGGTLLVAYSLGHCALILIGGTSMGLVQKMIESKGFQRANTWCKRIAGLAVIGVGVLLLAS
jgi:cytochrome c-type biogenesis protein